MTCSPSSRARSRGSTRARRSRTSTSRSTTTRTISKLAPEERAAADKAINETYGKKSIGEEILDAGKNVADAPTSQPNVEQAISKALRTHVGETADIGENIAEAAHVIGRYEKA